ncbi:MAG: NADH:flavin oxidoreductase/NADH oxidase [Alphaproteobacteria bacterium]|nr:NADH:flavin oxidoreductase/NADH oxidase [Alphaproteobacteria bacterium]
MPHLFSPLRIRSLDIKNRAWVSPMCQYSAKDGLPNDWHLVHLGSRAVGGAGLVMAEATGVAPAGRISPGDLGLWSDAHAQAFKPITAFIRAQGAIAAIQLAHAGRKGSADLPWKGGQALPPSDPDHWPTLSSSAVPFGPGWPAPREMTAQDIADTVAQFETAARRALDAGFQVAEIHMAHGYLLHQFLSPLSNKRTDGYGGMLENRMKFPLAVARAVRAAWPGDLPVFVRISATDWVEGGWDIDQSLRLAGELKKTGIDLIDCSTGGLVPDAKIPAAPGFQVPFAEKIRAETGIATGAVGLITQAKQAEEILAQGKADAVFLARELLRDPYWPLHAARELGADIAWPKQYERAKP